MKYYFFAYSKDAWVIWAETGKTYHNLENKEFVKTYIIKCCPASWTDYQLGARETKKELTRKRALKLAFLLDN